MFGISFPELLIIGVIALIVLGPERLPAVARTLGHLLGRVQRYVSDVKTDIQREINLDDMKSLKSQVQDASQSVRDSIQKAVQEVQDPLNEARSAVEQLSSEVKAPLDDAKQSLSDTANAVQQPFNDAKRRVSSAGAALSASVNDAKQALTKAPDTMRNAAADLAQQPASDDAAVTDTNAAAPAPETVSDAAQNALSGAFRRVTHDEVQAASDEAAQQHASIATPRVPAALNHKRSENSGSFEGGTANTESHSMVKDDNAATRATTPASGDGAVTRGHSAPKANNLDDSPFHPAIPDKGGKE